MSNHYSDRKNSVSSNSIFNAKSNNHVNSNKSYQTILATDIPLTYSETDLYSIFSRYGSVNKIQKLSKLSCCLIEFTDSISATNLIKTTKSKPFLIGAHKIKLELTSQSVSVPDQKSSDNSTHILSLTISNVKYPITVDIIKQICQKFGKLLRIFIGKKSTENVIESLVEFEKLADSKTAKDSLHGEDIYSGCCSLDVKYSRIPSVPVLKNDHESWDFTKESPTKSGILKSPPERPDPLPPPPLEHSNRLYRPQIYPVYPFPPPMFPPAFKACRQGPPPVPSPLPLPLGYGYFPINPHNNPSTKHLFLQEPGTVFMVQNLAPNVCADHLFNLFCIYGNIRRIRFVTKQSVPTTTTTEILPVGAALIQMGSRESADACVLHFHGRGLFGGAEMRLVRCPVRAEVEVPITPPGYSGGGSVPGYELLPTLPNGTAAYRDFSREPNNRFPMMGDSNHTGSTVSGTIMTGPNRTLHFFNAPPSFRDTDLTAMLLQSGVARPLQVVVFAARAPPSPTSVAGSISNNGASRARPKSGAGLIEFARLEDALVALCVLNHKLIILPDTGQAFHIKFNFSARGEPRSGPIGSVVSETAMIPVTVSSDEASSPKRCKSDDLERPRIDRSDIYFKTNEEEGEIDDIPKVDINVSEPKVHDAINIDSKIENIDLNLEKVSENQKIQSIDCQSRLTGSNNHSESINDDAIHHSQLKLNGKAVTSKDLLINNYAPNKHDSQSSIGNIDELSFSDSECGSDRKSMIAS